MSSLAIHSLLGLLLISMMAPTTGQAVHMPSEIIVRLNADLTLEQRIQCLREFGCTGTEACSPHRLIRARTYAGVKPHQVVEQLVHDERVDYAELNYVVWACFVPNDPIYPYQWNLQKQVLGGINAEPAWEIQQGDPNVIVAILDTGIAYETYGEFVQAPELSAVRFVPGYDFINEDDHPNDDHGHGTHIAGTIAQDSNDNQGVAGIAPGCSIMPVKVLDVNGLGDHFTVSLGIYYAVDHGAKVINLSLGAPSMSETLRRAMAYAYNRGVTVVCASGNEFQKGNPIIYPAAYDNYCIAVGATTSLMERAIYSGTGSYVDLVAPGGDTSVDSNQDGRRDGIIQQSFWGNPTIFDYWNFQGTSMATAHVSGAAALLLSEHGGGPDETRQRLVNTAKDLGAVGVDNSFGAGLINLGAAMTYGGSVQVVPGRGGSIIVR